jgi:hypothetical protein
MSAQPIPPTINDIPHGFTEADGVHEQTWEEKHQAEPGTAKARRKVGKLAASFNAFWHAAGFDDICKEAEIDAGALRRMYMTILELAMRAEDHAERDGHTPARVRRFHCPDYTAELCYRREYLRGDTQEEKERHKRTLARAWCERWKRTVHAAQCRNHLPLVERQSGGIFGKRKVATVYTERLADVLTMTCARADPNRGRVSRFTRAAEVALNHLRHTAEPYAPDFDYDPEPKDSEPTLDEIETETEAVDDPPYIAAIRRAVKHAKKGMTAAPPEEYIARRTEMIEWIIALMPVEGDAEQKNAHLPFFSVGIKVDAQKTEDAPPAEVVSKTHIPEGENCDFPAENSDSSEISVDVDIHHFPQFSGVEYEAEPEPRGQNLAEAEAALDACESVGVLECTAVMVDDTLPPGKNEVFSEQVTVADFRQRLERYMGHNGKNFTHSLCGRVSGIKHKYSTRRLIQVDDCSWEVVRLLKPFAFLVTMTSPGNYQVWLAISDVIPDHEDFKSQKRRLYQFLKPTGANGGAHGSIRWPGTLNRKPKRRYQDGESPRVQLIGVALGRTVSIAELDAAGLLAPLPPKKTPEQIREIKGRLPQGWPSMGEYLAKHKDRSTAEFAWSCRAIELGWPQYRVEEELARIGAKARTRTRDNYITETVANAARKVGIAAH